MSIEKKYYTAADIEKYHSGLLSAREMHELEKAALDDPFLADALEGYGATPVNISADISDLEERLRKKTKNDKGAINLRNNSAWWKIAAAIVVLAGAGFVAYELSRGNDHSKMSKLQEKKSDAQQEPATKNSTVIDSGTKPMSPLNQETVSLTVPAGAGKKQGKKEITRPDQTTQNENTEVTANDVSINQPILKKDSLDNTKRPVPGAVAGEKRIPPAANEPAVAFSEKRSAAGLSDDKVINYFRGQVVDADNHPLPFSNVTNTRDNVGTYADAQGNFTVISADSVLNLQVRSVGFQNNIVQLKKNAAVSKIVLKEDKREADRVLSFEKFESARSRTAYPQVEQPEPVDGWSNYNTYLANNLNIPEEFKIQRSSGKVELSFNVNQDGDPINFKIEKSLCSRCDEEAIRVIKQGPKWRKKNKNPTRAIVTVPFSSQK